MTQSLSKQYLLKKIQEDCIERGQFLGKRPGDRYSWQLYMSRLLYSSTELEIIAQSFFELFQDRPYDFQVAGREWSAIPLLTAFSLRGGFNSFMIRKQRKNYGIHNFVEGKPNGLPVLIVDDLCNSTDSFAHCKRVIEKELQLPLYPNIFAVVNKKRKDEDGWQYDKYLGSEFTAKTIFTLDEIFDENKL